MTAVATIKGTFVNPGVSKNRRFYSKQAIADAVAEAQRAINSGQTLAMMTNHGARDPLAGDVTRTAGRVTKVTLAPDGSAGFEAELADTQAGRDVAALVTGSHLKGVSMASMWKGTPRQMIAPDGQAATTADGFSLKGIDFTHNPGVTGAQIHSAHAHTWIATNSPDESHPSNLIYESLEDIVMTGSNAQPTYEEARRARTALDLLEAANRAEEDLTKASVGDLQALAALEFGNL
jgi:hypothetical protein